jgi:hypothetical protein
VVFNRNKNGGRDFEFFESVGSFRGVGNCSWGMKDGGLKKGFFFPIRNGCEVLFCASCDGFLIVMIPD